MESDRKGAKSRRNYILLRCQQTIASGSVSNQGFVFQSHRFSICLGGMYAKGIHMALVLEATQWCAPPKPLLFIGFGMYVCQHQIYCIGCVGKARRELPEHPRCLFVASSLRPAPQVLQGFCEQNTSKRCARRVNLVVG